VNESFAGYAALLGQFLARRQDIVDAIERRLLNVRDKPLSQSRNRSAFDEILTSCFFDLPGLPRDLSRLKGRLAASHRADGFEPVLIDNYSHELDPLQLIVRAYDYWDAHRWPGRSGRLTYAHCVYSVFLLRQLEYLSLRIWDEGHDRAGAGLDEVQRLLDRANEAPQANVFVRDARWLIQTAQGPLTRDVRPYFRIAGKIAGSFTAARRLELHKAGARLIGGHLRTQLRYRVWNTGRTIDDPETLAVTRNSNSMDSALLLGDLVPLLEAYQATGSGEDAEQRLDLADAILQGVSADPELFLTRLDLLCPSTMIEGLCVDGGAPQGARYTDMGDAHLALVERYGALIGELAASLKEDAAMLDPAGRVYSPFGMAYGFVADILSNMALTTLHARTPDGLSLEDMFVSQGALDRKLARAEAWQALPRREGEREHFDHSPEWARQMFGRLMDALAARALRPFQPNVSSVSTARLVVASGARDAESVSGAVLATGRVPAIEHCFVSDLNRALAIGAIASSAREMATLRSEGRFLASSETGGVWFGIPKVILTVITGQGHDALIDHVPPAVIEVLRLTCPGLVEQLDFGTAGAA
jgi:hypothetical protein